MNTFDRFFLNKNLPSQYEPVKDTNENISSQIPSGKTNGCLPYSNIFEITGPFFKTRRQIQYLKDLKYNFNSVSCCPLPPPCPCISKCFCN